MTRAEILDKAKEIVTLERQDQYGSPEANFEVIARLWTTYLNACIGLPKVDVDLSGEHVAAMMILLKAARTATGSGKDDNWLDIAGYAACGGEIFSE